MKQITMISGKGGTGKTALTSSFAVLAKSKIMVDCDVDASNLHILLHPQIKEQHEFKGGKAAIIDHQLCNRCGKCISLCLFEAIGKDMTIDRIDCEGCGLCSHICPQKAISMQEKTAGTWFVSDTKYGPLVHANLNVAEQNSGKLVACIKKAARQLAEKGSCEYIIIDGPPGIGCPVISSLAGSDLAVIVTEPTLSGLHDLNRVANLCQQLGVTALAVINKYDLSLETTKLMELSCQQRKLDIIGKLPFSSQINRAIVNTAPPMEYCDETIRKNISDIWQETERRLLEPGTR